MMIFTESSRDRAQSAMARPGRSGDALAPVSALHPTATHHPLHVAAIHAGLAGGARDVALAAIEQRAEVRALEALDPGVLRLVVRQREEGAVDVAARAASGAAGAGRGRRAGPARGIAGGAD